MQKTPVQRMLGSSLLFFLSWTALAQGTRPAEASCAAIVDDARRLACYDHLFRKGVTEQPRSTADTPTETSASAPTPAPAQAQARTGSAAAPEGEFGGEFRRPKVGPKRLNAVVTGVASLGQGLYRLTLDNGQVWDTTQADWTLDFQTSDRVIISKMMLGNFLIARAGAARTVAVKRVE
jgi:hypothetical protein